MSLPDPKEIFDKENPNPQKLFAEFQNAALPLTPHWNALDMAIIESWFAKVYLCGMLDGVSKCLDAVKDGMLKASSSMDEYLRELQEQKENIG